MDVVAAGCFKYLSSVDERVVVDIGVVVVADVAVVFVGIVVSDGVEVASFEVKVEG